MTDIYTIAEGKEYLRKNLDIGVRCPCCDQNAKRYRRKFNSAMAVCLIELYKLNTNEYIHIQELQDNKIFRTSMNGGNFATMAYWGVIESLPKDEGDTTKRTSGRWRITERGIHFVLDQITIPKYAYTYNMNLSFMSDEQITIREALKDNFDYQELMDGNLGDLNKRPVPSYLARQIPLFDPGPGDNII